MGKHACKCGGSCQPCRAKTKAMPRCAPGDLVCERLHAELLELDARHDLLLTGVKQLQQTRQLASLAKSFTGRTADTFELQQSETQLREQIKALVGRREYLRVTLCGRNPSFCNL